MIEIFDSRDLPFPPDRAVAQALASRSLKSLKEQIDIVNKDKTKTFIDKYVINYGHDSILDCADSIMISLPNISILAAKYIEDSPLFRGQESSTRYIDFSNQPIVTFSKFGDLVAAKSMDLFNSSFDEEFQYNLNKFKPTSILEKQSIRAYTFDVMRSILPVGLTTNVNWVTDLRHAVAHTTRLMSSHLPEVQKIAMDIYNKLLENYPGVPPINSTSILHMNAHEEEYNCYAENPEYSQQSFFRGFDLLKQGLDIAYIESDLKNIDNYDSLKTRPRGGFVPRIYSSNFTISGIMDFGSFRDLQRHRNGLCKIPLPNTNNGFEQWYLKNMSSGLASKVRKHINYLNKRYEALKNPYIVSLGYRVPFLYQASFEQLIYIAELRSSKHVHPTCRSIALHIAKFIETKFPEVALYIDKTPLDHFNSNRGKASIEGLDT